MEEGGRRKRFWVVVRRGVAGPVRKCRPKAAAETEREERSESGCGERERMGFPKKETLKREITPKIETSQNILPISVGHNFFIRTPILAYFISTNSV
jgi:hypothetical protein